MTWFVITTAMLYSSLICSNRFCSSFMQTIASCPLLLMHRIADARFLLLSLSDVFLSKCLRLLCWPPDGCKPHQLSLYGFAPFLGLDCTYELGMPHTCLSRFKYWPKRCCRSLSSPRPT
jgi:hypothetical protein